MELDVKYMRNSRVGWTVLIIIVAAVAVGVGVKLYMSRGADISQAQLLERMEQKSEICILDVRTVREYNLGHVPGAINVGHKDISARLDELRPHAGRTSSSTANWGFGREWPRRP